MSKKTVVWVADCDEETYKSNLEKLKEKLAELNNKEIRVIIADTDFYFTKLYTIEKILGKGNKIQVIDCNSDTPDKDINDYLTKRGYTQCTIDKDIELIIVKIMELV